MGERDTPNAWSARRQGGRAGVRNCCGVLGLLTLVSCEVPATAIVVRVETDIPSARDGGPLREVVIRANLGGASSFIDRTFSLGDDRFELPGELVLRASDPEDTRPLRLTVTGAIGEAESLSRTFTVRFSPRRTTLLEVFLANRCRAGVVCPPGYSCGRNGLCESSERGELPPYVPPADAKVIDLPDVRALDVEDRIDGGSDAQFDGGSDAQTTRDDKTPHATEDHSQGDDVGSDGSVGDGSDARDAIASGADVPVDRPSDLGVPCDGGTELCGGRCVDRNADISNCGSCGRACPAGTRCRGGACTSICPADSVWIPGGSFQMGSPPGIGEDGEHPEHMVVLSPYCLDLTEVTVTAYGRCVASGGASCPTPNGNTSSQCNWGVRGRENHPINCVLWSQASAFCAWMRGRLPTEAEWENAATLRGTRTYPWGEAAPGSQLCWSPNAAERRATTCPVRTYPAAAFGLFDMAGNVQEFASDWYAAYPSGTVTNPSGPASGTYRVNRDGNWFGSAPELIRYRGAYRGGSFPNVNATYIGFRCAYPGSP